MEEQPRGELNFDWKPWPISLEEFDREPRSREIRSICINAVRSVRRLTKSDLTEEERNQEYSNLEYYQCWRRAGFFQG